MYPESTGSPRETPKNNTPQLLKALRGRRIAAPPPGNQRVMSPAGRLLCPEGTSSPVWALSELNSPNSIIAQNAPVTQCRLLESNRPLLKGAVRRRFRAAESIPAAGRLRPEVVGDLHAATPGSAQAPMGGGSQSIPTTGPPLNDAGQNASEPLEKGLVGFRPCGGPNDQQVPFAARGQVSRAMMAGAWPGRLPARATHRDHYIRTGRRPSREGLLPESLCDVPSGFRDAAACGGVPAGQSNGLVHLPGRLGLTRSNRLIIPETGPNYEAPLGPHPQHTLTELDGRKAVLRRGLHRGASCL